ncbi:MAG: hydroxyacid dehydrogenase [Chloroflexi bacterium]|nr:hydroxyacid dehydrogenase [Chloroflexota bacterium]
MMSSLPQVIVDPHFRSMGEIFHPKDLARLERIATVVWGQDTPMPQAAFEAAIPDAAAVVCADWHYGDGALEMATHLRAVLTVSGGFPRSMNYELAFARQIRVLSAAPAFARSVAELALAMALAASRDVVSGDRAMRAGNEKWLHAGNAESFMLYGKRVGFIGHGNLAQALHPLLMPFGVSVSVYDPWLGEGYLRTRGVEPVGLDELLATSRVIFVLAAPSSENQALISRERLALIQPGAVFVLVSRAHVVDFEALTEFVSEGRFKAALDVFPSEPLEADHPLRRAEHAILSAHKAGPTVEGCQEIGQMLVDDLEAILQGLPPQRLQNAEPELVRRYLGGTIKPR